MRNKTIILMLVAQLAFIASIGAQNIAINTAGTAANAAAILDLTNTANLGLLIPAITTATLPTTVATGSQGLLFYNTTSYLFNVNTSTNTTPTFVPVSNVAITNGLAVATVNSVASITSTVNSIASSFNFTAAIAAAAWVLSSGNTVTAATTATYGNAITAGNFIGTTNAQDLVLVTNNLERTRILNGSGYVGIGTAAPVATLDVEGTFGSNMVTLTTSAYTIGAIGSTIYYLSTSSTPTNLILPLVINCNCNYRRYTLINTTASSPSLYTSSALTTISNFTNLKGVATNIFSAYSMEIIADPLTSTWLQIK